LEDRLKIYADQRWLPPGTNHVIMLYPFWGDIPLSDTDPDKGRFSDYIKEGNDIFKMTEGLNECEVAVLPFEYSFENSKKKLAEKAANDAKQAGKKIIVFFNSDSTGEINIENALVFRTSFFRSKQKTNEFAFPGWSIDFMKKFNGNKEPLKKTPKAKISYCGYVDSMDEPKKGIKGSIKAMISPVTKEKEEYGSLLRGKAVRALKSDNSIDKDLIIRDGFWAQGITDKIKVRQEYMQNMFNSPYALVTRGAGNFSYRLLEVMSCGRIPVFIHTDSVLPMEKKIDWKRQTVWVEENEIEFIGKKISDFHNNISENAFTELQRENRRIYETYLSPVGYFKHLNAIV
jgi:hypothetical protein